jgi:hypothetical protein
MSKRSNPTTAKMYGLLFLFLFCPYVFSIWLSLFEGSDVKTSVLIVVPKVAVKVLAGVVDAGVLQQRDVGVQSLHWHLQNKGEKVKTKRMKVVKT